MAAPPVPSTKEELVKATQRLPYHDRVQLASRVGRSLGGDKAKTLATELRQVRRPLTHFAERNGAETMTGLGTSVVGN